MALEASVKRREDGVHITGGERRFPGWDLGYHFADDEGYELTLLRGMRGDEALDSFERIRVQANTFAATATP